MSKKTVNELTLTLNVEPGFDDVALEKMLNEFMEKYNKMDNIYDIGWYWTPNRTIRVRD